MDRMTDFAVVSLDQPLAGIADELGNSFAEYGFAVIRDHGIPQELIDRAEARSKEFFALPEEAKRAYHQPGGGGARGYTPFGTEKRSEEHTSELQSLMRISYAVFCLKKKKNIIQKQNTTH